MPEVLQRDYDCEELSACRAIVPLSVIKYSRKESYGLLHTPNDLTKNCPDGDVRGVGVQDARKIRVRIGQGIDLLKCLFKTVKSQLGLISPVEGNPFPSKT